MRIVVTGPPSAPNSFTDKEDLRNRRYDLSNRRDILHWFSSSGSTGRPVLYPWSRADEDIATAVLRRIHPDCDFSGGTALVVAPTGLSGMWYHMNRQLQHLGMATVFPATSPESIFGLMEQLEPVLLIS